MKWIIIILTLVSANLTLSQDYGKEIKRILTDFSELKAYHIKAEVFVSGEEDFSFEAAIKVSKYGSHTITDNTEMFVNKNYVIAIDHDEKTIRVDKDNYKVKSKGKSELGLDMLDQQINEQGGVEYLGKTDTYRTYVIHQDAAVTKTVVKISNETNFFHEIEVFYESEDISISSYKVKYTLFDRNPNFKSNDFDERKVIQKSSNGQLAPTAKYKEYRVIKQF